MFSIYNFEFCKNFVKMTRLLKKSMTHWNITNKFEEKLYIIVNKFQVVFLI